MMRETVASDIWQKLKDKYITKNIEIRFYLKKILFLFQYKLGTCIYEYLNKFHETLADLWNLNIG